MAQRHTEAIFVSRIRKPLRDADPGLSLEKEIRVPVQLFWQIRVHVEVIRFHLDHADDVVGGNWKAETGRVTIHETRNDLLAFPVQLVDIEIQAANRASERIAKQLHLLAVPSHPGALALQP